MTITCIPPKMKTIDSAIEFEIFHKQLRRFMGINNLTGIDIILHILNSFYFMSPDLEKIYKNDNDTTQNHVKKHGR